MTTTFIVMLAAVIVVIGLAKGGLGGVLAEVATPLLATVMPAQQVIGLLLPILMVGDVFAVWAHWNRWDKKRVLLLIPGAILGVAVGTYLLASISPITLRRGIGLIILLFVVYKLFEARILSAVHYTPRNWHGVLAGGASAVASTLAHTGSPPIVIYLMMQENMSPRTFVATSALFFALLNWLKVPSYYMAGLFDFHMVWQVAWLLPLLPLSVWLGKTFASRVNKVIFDRVIAAVLAVTAVLLLVK